MTRQIPTEGHESRVAAVAAMLDEGLSTQEIAARLNIKHQTAHSLVNHARNAGPNDLCGHLGAVRLRARIAEYWRLRGYEVDVQLHAAPFTGVMRSARVDVRSDLVNGLPRRRIEERVR